jgi:hypothetical protein
MRLSHIVSWFLRIFPYIIYVKYKQCANSESGYFSRYGYSPLKKINTFSFYSILHRTDNTITDFKIIKKKRLKIITVDFSTTYNSISSQYIIILENVLFILNLFICTPCVAVSNIILWIIIDHNVITVRSIGEVRYRYICVNRFLKFYITLWGLYMTVCAGRNRNDHTTMTAPLPVCSAKLSIVWPG